MMVSKTGQSNLSVKGGNIHLPTVRLSAILLLAWLALFAGINTIPLEDHDAFVLETAREMGITHDWVLPYFNREPRLNKPPLNYWLTLGTSYLDPFTSDIEPWHGRVFSLISGLLVLLMTAYIGTKLYGGQAGFLAAALLLGTKGFTEFSHCARPDFLYSSLCVLQLYFWIAAWRAQDDSSAQRLNAALGWLLAALAILSKGPQVPAVFLVGFLLFLLCGADRHRTLKVVRPFSGMVILLAVCLPWWLLLQDRVKLLGVNIHETQLSGSLLKTMSGWKEIFTFFYITRLMLLLLPTTLLVPLLLYVKRKTIGRPDDSDRLLLFVGLTMLAVFTVAGHYRPHYILPLMPLAALLLAGSADRISIDVKFEKAWQWLFWAGAASLAIYPLLLIGKQQYAPGLLLAGTGSVLIVLLKKELRAPVWHNHPLTAKLLSCSLLAALLFAGFNAYSYRGNRDGDREFSLSVGAMLQPGDVLLALSSYPHALPYYARHTVVAVSGLDDLQKRVAHRAEGQEFYVLVAQDEIERLRGIAEISPLLVLGGKKTGEQTVFAKIRAVRS